MAYAASGEVSLQVGANTVRLRLDIGTMMDLEDYFGMGLVPFLTDRLPEFRLSDLTALYLAMTGGDFTNTDARRRAGGDLVEAGLSTSANAIAACLSGTLNPAQNTGSNRGQNTDQTPDQATAQTPDQSTAQTTGREPPVGKALGTA